MRRPVVLAPLAALLVVLVVVGLRGARVDDADRAAAAAERYGLAVADRDAGALCRTLLASRVTERLARADAPCERTLDLALAQVEAPRLRVLDADADGDVARVRVATSAVGEQPSRATLELRLEDGGWRVATLDGLQATGPGPGDGSSRRRGGPPAPGLTPGVAPLVTVPRDSQLADGIAPRSDLPPVPTGPLRPSGRRGDRNDAAAGGTAAAPADLRRAREAQGERTARTGPSGGD